MWLLPILSAVSTLASRVFYRLDISGPEVPSTGPVLLVANHPNSLIDPALVGAAAGRPVRFLAKSTLFDHPTVGWLVRAAGAIPVYRRTDDSEAAARNVDMFAAVHAELGRGAAVGIFPEGVSHSDPALAELKTGSARIALGASQREAFPLIPIGLVLRDKGVFRSEALVMRGAAVEWDDLVSRGAEDRAAVRELTRRLERGLREVTINLERWEDRPLVDSAAAVWQAERAEVGGEPGSVAVPRAVAQILADLRRTGDPVWRQLARDVDRHRRRLAVLGLEPTDLDAKVDLGSGAAWLVKSLPLGLPPLVLVGVVGWLIFWPPYQATRGIVWLLGPDVDQQSTYKVLVGAPVYLIWLLAMGSIGWWRLGAAAGLGVLLVLPLLGGVGLWVRERWWRAWKDVRRFFLLRSRREVRRRLENEQTRLAGRLEEAWQAWRRSEG